jgi:integrase
MGSILERGDKYYLKWTDAFGPPQRKVCAAKTKREASLLLAELELKVDRQKKGLEAMPVRAAEMTFAQLCAWWLKTKCSPNSLRQEESRLETHITSEPIGLEPLRTIDAARLQRHFDDLKGPKFGPASSNKLRSTLLSVFKAAKKAGMWGLENPAAGVGRREVMKVMRQTLRAEEVPAVLGQVPEEWRGFFAAALWWGLRKGELCGLQKQDIDWEFLTVWVCRSYEYDTTKGGHGDSLPIPPPLIPFLREAVQRSPSRWVFPGPDGLMRTSDCDPNAILKTALSRAGLIDGWIHSCRRCTQRGGEHVERHPDANDRWCPACGMKLLPRPVPRQMRFHDLRHTAATLLVRAKVPWPQIQKIMRHANIQTTLGTYGHLDVEDLRVEMNKLIPLSEEQQRQLVAVNSGPNNSGPTEVQAMRESGAGTPDNQEKALMSEDLQSGRRGGRTPDHRLVKATQQGAAYTSAFPTVQHHSTRARGVGSQEPSTLPPVGQHSVPGRVHLRAVAEGVENLLSVSEVAKRLGVHKASVYRLCESGALRHSRILSSIRIAESDLADYLAGVGQ